MTISEEATTIEQATAVQQLKSQDMGPQFEEMVSQLEEDIPPEKLARDQLASQDRTCKRAKFKCCAKTTMSKDLSVVSKPVMRLKEEDIIRAAPDKYPEEAENGILRIFCTCDRKKDISGYVSWAVAKQSVFGPHHRSHRRQQQQPRAAAKSTSG